LDNNRNFGEKSTFLTKINIFDKNQHFWQKSKFWTRIEILDKNRNFEQESKFWKKSKFWRKINICDKNRNFEQKSKFWTKIEILEKNKHFWQKSKFWTKIPKKRDFSTAKVRSIGHLFQTLTKDIFNNVNDPKNYESLSNTESRGFNTKIPKVLDFFLTTYIFDEILNEILFNVELTGVKKSFYDATIRIPHESDLKSWKGNGLKIWPMKNIWHIFWQNLAYSSSQKIPGLMS